MAKELSSLDKLIDSLEERVKELNCLYEVEEILQRGDATLDEIFNAIVPIIAGAFQYPEICQVKIVYRDNEYTTKKYQESKWVLNADITVRERSVGWVRVCYTEEKPESEIGPFLSEEKRLLNTIAQRLGHYLMYQKLKKVFNKWESAKQDYSTQRSGEWGIILELLRRTDPDLFMRITRKMLNHLVWQGIQEAEQLLAQFNPYGMGYRFNDVQGESNVPLEKRTFADLNKLSNQIFDVASRTMPNPEILARIQQWVQEDKTSFLVRTTADNNSSLTDIREAIHRYYQINPIGMELSPSTKIGVRAALIRRFFSDQLEFINIAKNYCRVIDFNDLLQRTIFPIGSHGKLGGKSAGMFLAYRILQTSDVMEGILDNVTVPKTWYISSDAMIHFMHHNNLDEILEQKYKPVEEVRKEYPHVVQLFKNSHFPGEIIQGLSMALDDFGEKPLVVRSSSLLEDRLGSAFSGKYKSLFIANQGSKGERLSALMDAIAEVYASTIGPDPIEYRAERGLLDYHEEMGIMIQEVVGKRVGDYFFPAFAGVAFSNNEFRWSPRIKREDGLLRVVPGLGTRAVDRLADDYPILIAPGLPGLRANVSTDEIVRYSPQKIDVVNLKTNTFETVEIKQILKECGNEYPIIEKLTSIYEHGQLAKPGFNTDFSSADLVVSFDGLINDTKFIDQAWTILKELQNKLATPVDIEFAHDGEKLYLLQCRPQSYSKYSAPAAIPANIDKDQLIFSANRFVSNGIVPDIRYIVYVDPLLYNELSHKDDLNTVGRIISQLNKILPRRQFILMGPGRWGSRGDIKLGVNVSYSDINNTAVLIEIARKKGNYVPDLSFGTHFFQDLVEAGIRYLPLYPDDHDNIFNEEFLINSPNALFELLPSYSFMSDVVHVIEVRQASDGLLLHILMNADLDRAVGLLGVPGYIKRKPAAEQEEFDTARTNYGLWRMQMAERIASQLSPSRFGVKALYVLGSTRTSTAQAGSDIDLLVHFTGSKAQKEKLENWFEGWSLCLDELNYQMTGFKAGGLLDIHYISDTDEVDEDVILERLEILNPKGIKKLRLADNNK